MTRGCPAEFRPGGAWADLAAAHATLRIVLAPREPVEANFRHLVSGLGVDAGPKGRELLFRRKGLGSGLGLAHLGLLRGGWLIYYVCYRVGEHMSSVLWVPKVPKVCDIWHCIWCREGV